MQWLQLKLPPLLFALHSDKIKPKQLKSLQDHGNLNQINSSWMALWSSWKMCINRHIKGRVSRQKPLPKEALSLSLIAPGTDNESYSATLISKAGGGRWQMYRQRWCPSYSRLWKMLGYHWHLEQWWARDRKWGWEWEIWHLCLQEAPGRQEWWSMQLLLSLLTIIKLCASQTKHPDTK